MSTLCSGELKNVIKEINIQFISSKDKVNKNHVERFAGHIVELEATNTSVALR